jgi:uncharacterized membrane protein
MNPMNATIPQTIPQYLAQVRDALAGADPAVIQDALYDAEEHLRAELAASPGVSEADLLRRIATSYGSPEEVAAIYRDTEVTVSRAMRTPQPPRRASLAGRFFGVAADPRTYGALFYMLLSLATGIFYFTWATTGASLSLGLSVLIIGIPFIVLFIGTVRVLSLVEGRIVETLLGVRMPRRPAYVAAGQPLLARIKGMFVDPRTWSTLLYLLLMLPLGTLYFTLAVTGLSVSLGLVFGPVASLVLDAGQAGVYLDGQMIVPAGLALPVAFLLGVLGLFATLHLARGLGSLHGRIAHHLLVKAAAGGEAAAPRATEARTDAPAATPAVA